MLAVILLGFLTKKVSATAAKVGLIGGPVLFYLLVFSFGDDVQTFLRGLFRTQDDIHFLHLLGFVFVLTVVVMLAVSWVRPAEKIYQPTESHVVDVTPWKYARQAGIAITVVTILFYVLLSQ